MSSGGLKNSERKRGDGDRPGQDQNRARPDNEIDVTASVGGHDEPERHEDATDGYQEDVHRGFVLGEVELQRDLGGKASSLT